MQTGQQPQVAMTQYDSGRVAVELPRRDFTPQLVAGLPPGFMPPWLQTAIERSQLPPSSLTTALPDVPVAMQSPARQLPGTSAPTYTPNRQRAGDNASRSPAVAPTTLRVLES